ncbi:glycosyltransferase [Albirhodobacter sp. R86504]|uniref:glycosyltransferase n=1 Tax=Albirhodobacter sp. R86504 TaxID=3093848 RepID=UPI00366F82BC
MIIPIQKRFKGKAQQHLRAVGEDHSYVDPALNDPPSQDHTQAINARLSQNAPDLNASALIAPQIASDLARAEGRPVSVDQPPLTQPSPKRTPLGQLLLEAGAVDPGNLLKALSLRERQDVRLGDILLAHGWVRENDLMAALARQWNATVVDLVATPPDPRLIDKISAEACLARSMVPWTRIGGTTVIATARPEEYRAMRDDLPPELGPYAMVLAAERDIHESLLARRQTSLIRKAETRVKPSESCRTRDEKRLSRIMIGIVAVIILGLAYTPVGMLGALVAWMLLSMVVCTALKVAAFITNATHPDAVDTEANLIRLPIVSIMVPLFKERDIASKLLVRLSRLNYPRELLDIMIVVEQSDEVTIQTIEQTTLPRWIRVVKVPNGPIKTKPRALNYALNFCRGSLIGVYDAEDAPDPDQIHTVVRRFSQRGPDLACVQGILDYYNPRTNWLARCFTIEYASWFRAMLPGVAKMGLVVPLGGTTLFFRREAIERLGGWDAHNVTEDADLGVRLARYGYRTALVQTVTHEEANCRALPWVKQRSRWLKGYAITWGVHMRDPVALWRDLGAWRWFGFQIQFFGTLSQYLLIPLLWSFWLIPFGIWHPVSAYLPKLWVIAMGSSFVLVEIVNLCVSLWAVRAPQHRHLMPWTFTLNLYFPLGALAGWKAIYEAIVAPYYWDKTTHGIFDAHGAIVPATPGSDANEQTTPGNSAASF